MIGKMTILAGVCCLGVLATACGPGTPSDDASPAKQPEASVENKIVSLLKAGKPVFGVFSGPKTPESAAALAADPNIDFVFYSLEHGPFDLETMQGFMQALAKAAGDAGLKEHPLMLRIPPIRDGAEEAENRVHQALDKGVYSVVFPHVENAQEAALAVRSMRYQDASAPGPAGTRPPEVGDAPEYWGVSAEEYHRKADLWPLNPEGQLVNLLIIEDQEGIAHARETVSTEGVSIVFPGPGDLSRAYEGDAEKIEAAIQTVLAACKEFDVVCGITAGVDDIAERLQQGFRVIIVTEPEAIAAGRAAAGRGEE